MNRTKKYITIYGIGKGTGTAPPIPPRRMRKNHKMRKTRRNV